MPTKRKPSPKAKKRNILSYFWVLLVLGGLGWFGYTLFIKPTLNKQEVDAVAGPDVQQQIQEEAPMVQQQQSVPVKKGLPVKQQAQVVGPKKPIEEAKEISDLVGAILEKLVGLAMTIMGGVMLYLNIKAKQLEIKKEEEEESK